MKLSRQALKSLARIEQMLLKHLQGEHNQMSHGGGGGAASPDTGGGTGGGETKITDYLANKKEESERTTAEAERLEEKGESHEYDAMVHIATALDQDVNVPLSQRREWRFAYSVDKGTNQVVAAGSMKYDKVGNNIGTTAEVKNVGSIRKGEGTKVMKEILRIAKQDGMKKVRLISTGGAFYEKMGFTYNSKTHFMEMDL